jgi:hypothetical protein
MPGMAPIIPGKRAHSKAEKYDLALDSSPMNIFNAPGSQAMNFT